VDLDAVAEAIATRAKTVEFELAGVTKHLTAHGQALDSLAELPCLEVGEIDADYDKTFGAHASRLIEYVYTCRIYASTADDRHGQKLLRQFVRGSGPTSIKQAVEGTDLTLGGLCQQLRAERVRGYGVYEVGGDNFYGARMEIRVWGRG
jgi:hypothetical protein